MYEYLIILIIYIIEACDIGHVVARYEMYDHIKHMTMDKKTEISFSLYSSICFYLLPDDKFIKITRYLPITYLFDRQIKKSLKNKTYNKEPILLRLEIKNIKPEDIKKYRIYKEEYK